MKGQLKVYGNSSLSRNPLLHSENRSTVQERHVREKSANKYCFNIDKQGIDLTRLFYEANSIVY